MRDGARASAGRRGRGWSLDEPKAGCLRRPRGGRRGTRRWRGHGCLGGEPREVVETRRVRPQTAGSGAMGRPESMSHHTGGEGPELGTARVCRLHPPALFSEPHLQCVWKRSFAREMPCN